VAAVYFVACMVFGVTIWKGLLTAVLFILQSMALGTRRIAPAGLAFFMLAGVYPIEILPLQKWFHLAALKIDTVLQYASAT
jgi:hypothetical protein